MRLYEVISLFFKMVWCMRYYIKSGNRYWRANGNGYTLNSSEAGIFTVQSMARFNLDGCTLERTVDADNRIDVALNQDVGNVDRS